MSPKLLAKHALLVMTFLTFALSTQAQTQSAPYDFDDDRKSDVAVCRPSTSFWYIFQSQSQTAR